jgi:hypothetical protein
MKRKLSNLTRSRNQKGVIIATKSNTDYKKRMKPIAMIEALKSIAAQ